MEKKTKSTKVTKVTKKELTKKDRKKIAGGTYPSLLNPCAYYSYNGSSFKGNIPPGVEAIIKPKYTATYLGENSDGEKYERT